MKSPNVKLDAPQEPAKKPKELRSTPETDSAAADDCTAEKGRSANEADSKTRDIEQLRRCGGRPGLPSSSVRNIEGADKVAIQALKEALAPYFPGSPTFVFYSSEINAGCWKLIEHLMAFAQATFDVQAREYCRYHPELVLNTDLLEVELVPEVIKRTQWHWTNWETDVDLAMRLRLPRAYYQAYLEEARQPNSEDQRLLDQFVRRLGETVSARAQFWRERSRSEWLVAKTERSDGLNQMNLSGMRPRGALKDDPTSGYEEERAAAYCDFYLALEVLSKLPYHQAICVPSKAGTEAVQHSLYRPPGLPSRFEEILFILYERIVRAYKRSLVEAGLLTSEIIFHLAEHFESLYQEIYVARLEEFAQRAGSYAANAFPEPYLLLLPANARGHTSQLFRIFENEVLAGEKPLPSEAGREPSHVEPIPAKPIHIGAPVSEILETASANNRPLSEYLQGSSAVADFAANVLDRKLRKMYDAVTLYERYKAELRQLKAASKKYQTPQLLKQQFPALEVWAALEKDDERSVAVGDFLPGHFAWALIKRTNGLVGKDDRTLKNHRKALRAADVPF